MDSGDLPAARSRWLEQRPTYLCYPKATQACGSLAKICAPSAATQKLKLLLQIIITFWTEYLPFERLFGLRLELQPNKELSKSVLIPQTRREINQQRQNGFIIPTTSERSPVLRCFNHCTACSATYWAIEPRLACIWSQSIPVTATKLLI